MHYMVALPRWGCEALGRSSGGALSFDSHHNLGPQ